MTKRRTSIFLCITILYFLNSHAIADDQITMEDIVAGLQLRKQMLSRMEVHYSRDDFKKVKNDSFASGVSLEKIQSRGMYVTRKGEKVRVETDAIEKEYPQTQQKYFFQDIFAWDGEKRMGYSHDPKNPKNIASGSIADNKNGGAFKSGYWQTPLEQTVFDIPAPLADLVSLQKDKWSIEGPEKIGPYVAYKLVSQRKPSDNWNAEVWISPDHGFAPVRIKMSLTSPKIKPIYEEMRDVMLVNVDGAWVQKSSIIEITNKNRPNQISYVQKVNFDKYKIGHDIPDDLFVVQFPQGARVWDDIKKIAYIVGEGVIIKGNDGLVDIIKYNTLSQDIDNAYIAKIDNGRVEPIVDTYANKEILKEQHAVVSENSANNIYLLIVTIVFIMIVIVLGAILLFKIHRRKKNER